jgi:hypothetical protein
MSNKSGTKRLGQTALFRNEKTPNIAYTHGSTCCVPFEEKKLEVVCLPQRTRVLKVEKHTTQHGRLCTHPLCLFAIPV